MTAWWSRRLCAFDCETTGVDTEEARIVTAAVALVGGGEPADVVTQVADPGVEIPAEAAEVHGYTTERARAEGAPPADVVRSVVERLAMAASNGWPLVIYNARFDLTILDREARRYGIAPLAERQVELLVVDPLVLDKTLDRFRRGSRKLEATCAHYGATLDDAHDAGADAIAAARLAWCIGRRGAVVRRVRNQADATEKSQLEREWATIRGSLPLLHAAQVDWAREQALGLAAYFRSQGNVDAADGVQTEWPVVPVSAISAVAQSSAG